MAQMVNNVPMMQETWVLSLGREDLLEKGMATHSRMFAWRIPWMEEPRRLPSRWSQRVGHNWANNTFTVFYFLRLYQALQRPSNGFHVLFNKHTCAAPVQCSPLSAAPQGGAGPISQASLCGPWPGESPSLVKEKQLIWLPHVFEVSCIGGQNAGLISARVGGCLQGKDSLLQHLLQNRLGAARLGPCSAQQNYISIYWKYPIQWHFQLIKLRVSNFLSVPPRAVLPAWPLCLQWDFTGRVCDLLAWIAVNHEHTISQKRKQSSLSWKIIL